MALKGKKPSTLRCVETGDKSFSRKINQHHMGVVLYSFEDDLLAIGRQVEVLNVEVGRKIGQLPLSASLQIDGP